MAGRKRLSWVLPFSSEEHSERPGYVAGSGVSGYWLLPFTPAFFASDCLFRGQDTPHEGLTGPGPSGSQTAAMSDSSTLEALFAPQSGR